MASKVVFMRVDPKEDENEDELVWEDELRVYFTVKPPCQESAAVMTMFRVSRSYLTSDNKASNSTVIPMLLSHTLELPPQFFNNPSIIRRVSAASRLVPTDHTRRLHVLLRPSKENEKLCYIKCFWHVLGEEFCDVEAITRPMLEAKRENRCCICLEELRFGSKAMYLPCSHVFHGNCIAKWLEMYCKSCPMCRCRLVEQSV